MRYDKNYFIAKFEAIPEDKWCTHTYGKDGHHCALGHCGDSIYVTTSEADSLDKLLQYKTAFINDGELLDSIDYSNYGDTPKQRILTALRLLP